MKFQLTNDQIKAVAQTLDVALKATGLQGLDTIVQLANAFGQAEGEEVKTVALTEEQVKSFQEVLDITLKTIGLNGAYGVMELVKVFNSPLQEEAPQEELVAQ